MLWIITRDAADAARDVEALRAAGIAARPVPCIELVPAPLQPWPEGPGQPLYVLTSRHAARRMLDAGEVMERVAAVAPSTAELLDAAGVPVLVRASGGSVGVARAVVDHWRRLGAPPWHVRYPTSDAGVAMPEQTEAVQLLSEVGPVHRQVVYRTTAPAGVGAQLAGVGAAPFGVCFASPSAVSTFLASVDPAATAPARVLCLGRSTVEAWNGRRPGGWPPAMLTASLVKTIVTVEEPAMKLPVRLRRMRTSVPVRAMFAETTVAPRNLVQPYFVMAGKGVRQETRPGIGLWHVTPDLLREEVSMLARGGVGGVMLFGVPQFKRDDGKELEKQLEPLKAAIGEAKAAAPELPLFCDVCLCSYTSHGHCGLVENGRILNDESVSVLSEMAVLLARWGVDFVCPSDMMDGRVRAIRSRLDEEGLSGTSILSYAIKMASAFYGPFREAAHSAPAFGDRRSYQMPASNRREARRELLSDEAEGADALLVKPAMSNLDLIRDAREATDLPLFAYQVSGEYAMMRAAADVGLLDFERAVEESLVSIRRAGADVVISYAAREWAKRS